MIHHIRSKCCLVNQARLPGTVMSLSSDIFSAIIIMSSRSIGKPRFFPMWESGNAIQILSLDKSKIKSKTNEIIGYKMKEQTKNSDLFKCKLSYITIIMVIIILKTIKR